MTSHYFNRYSAKATNEQDLHESLIVEAISICGADVYYLPRESWADEPDSIYGEDVSSKFTSAYKIDMYINTTEFYGGQGDFFSKLGLSIRDTSNFVVAHRTFDKILSSIRTVPREGDLLYVPTQNKIYEIKFVEQNLMFFSLGKRTPYVYELRCEAFRYSHEDIETGVEEIDILDNQIAYTVSLQLLTGSGSGDYQIGETVSTANASGEVANFTPSTKIVTVVTTDGAFIANTTLTGATSNSIWTIQTVNDRGNNTKYDHTDALEIQEQANTILDTSEQNPFGYPA